LFAERDEGVHSSQRRLVSRIYAMDSHKNLEPYIDDAIARLVEILRGRQDSVRNIGRFVQLFAFG